MSFIEKRRKKVKRKTKKKPLLKEKKITKYKLFHNTSLELKSS